MTRPGAVAAVSVVALIFAGLASWGVYNYLEKETEKTKISQSGKVMVAAADLPTGTKINPTQLKAVSWPKENQPAGSYSDTSQLSDRIVARPIAAGDVVTEQKLLPKDAKAAGGIMSYIVPEGHRAVTVGVNEVAGVAGFLTPNNHVDVILTTQIPGSSNENISKIILQDVAILATGQIASESKDGKPVVVPTVTLDLKPDDAEKLVVASSKGSLQLLLRNVVDNAPTETKGATIVKVLGGVERAPARTVVAKAARRPAKPAHAKVEPVRQPPPPPSPYNVEVIKGASKSTRQFEPEKE